MQKKIKGFCPIIVALDIDTKKEALEWVNTFKNQVDIFKVGLQLFSKEGPPIIKTILAKGKKVFLDLKLHDIPNTVAHAVSALAQPGVLFLTLHAAGGKKMMEAAFKSLQAAKTKKPAIKTQLLAVTILTSLDQDDLKSLGISSDLHLQVLRLTKLAYDSGIQGVVASPLEIELLRNKWGKNLILVTPGIRSDPKKIHDQKRTLSPKEAIQKGSNFLVMGRSLLETPNPQKNLKQILESLT